MHPCLSSGHWIVWPCSSQWRVMIIKCMSKSYSSLTQFPDTTWWINAREAAACVIRQKQGQSRGEHCLSAAQKPPLSAWSSAESCVFQGRIRTYKVRWHRDTIPSALGYLCLCSLSTLTTLWPSLREQRHESCRLWLLFIIRNRLLLHTLWTPLLLH